MSAASRLRDAQLADHEARIKDLELAVGRINQTDLDQRLADLEEIVPQLIPLLSFLPPSGLDITAPVVADVQVTSITDTSFVVSWTTNEPSTSQINYGLTGAYGSSTTANSLLVTSHIQTVSNLSASTLYHYRVRSTDEASNEVVDVDRTTTTGAASTGPTIMMVNATSGGGDAYITWTTDTLSDSRVEYGLTSSYGTFTTLDSTLVTSHVVPILATLTPSTLYYYRVISEDGVGSTTSAGGTFIMAATGTYLDMILSRSGVLGAWLFGDDSGGTFLDRTAAVNDGTWTGSPTLTTVSPIPGDTKTAATLAVSNVGTIPHISAYDRGDGPFAIEYWAKVSAAGDMRAAMLVDSPTMLLPLDEPSGTNADDATANNHDGTLTAGASFAAAVLVGADSSVDIDGTDPSSIGVADHADFDLGNGPFSIAFTLKRDSVGSQVTVFSKGSGATDINVKITASDFMVLSNGDDTAQPVYAGTAADTARHSYVITYAGASTGLIYEDGVNITSGTGTEVVFVDNATDISIGALTGSTERVDGTIAYVGVYPTAISSDRVADWYSVIDSTGAVDHYVVSKSNFSSDGWAARSITASHALTDWAGTVNVTQLSPNATGWHHIVLNRGTGADGLVYVDGVDVTSATGSITFSNSASDLLLTADGGLYGVVYYDRVVTAAEAAQAADYAYVSPPTTTRPIYGFGSQVTGGAGFSAVQVTNLNSSGAGSFALAYTGGGDRIITFTVGGTIDIPTELVIDGASNITIDGSTAPGQGITFKGESLSMRYGARNIILRDFRHRGFGTTAAQLGDNISPERDVAGIVMTRLSLSGGNDEAIGCWDRITDVTIQDVIIGPHQPAAAGHNFAVLFGDHSKRCTFHHNLIYGSNYRNPAVGWDGDVVAEAATELVGDVVNNLIWDYLQYGISVYNQGAGNVIGNYVQGRTNNTAELVPPAQGYFSGNFSRDGYSFPGSNASRFTVPTYAVVPEDASALAAAQSILLTAGCRVGGLDAYDQDIIDTINAVGL